MTLHIRRRSLLQLTAAGALALGGARARAATGRVYFGFQAGTLSNAIAEMVLKPLAQDFQLPFDTKLTIVPGNSSARAFEAIRNGPSDGTNMALIPSSIVFFSPLMNPTAGSDPLTDLTPVAPVFQFAFMFCVGPAVPATVKTLKDYAAWATETPTKATYCLPGLGSQPHAIAAMMARSIGVLLRPVGYQGNAPVVKEVVGGGQPAGMIQIGTANEAVQSGELRPLFVASPRRWPGLPDVPTLNELTGLSLSSPDSYGFFVHASTPAAKVASLNEAISSVVRRPEMAAFAATISTVPNPASAAEYAAELAANRRYWTQLLKQESFKLEN
jgi:tripartite-type tricarboxylate transporter receptor subunit TctC